MPALPRIVSRPLVMAAPSNLTRTVSFDDEVLVGGVSLDGEEFAERNLDVAVLHRQGGDLGRRLAGELVGGDDLGFDGDVRGAAVAQYEHPSIPHNSPRLGPTAVTGANADETARGCRRSCPP